MKAIILDDSRTMRRLLSNYIAEFASDIVEAEDGMVGLEQLEKNAPLDLALVDWDMPRMNGLEFVEAVRANPSYAEMKRLMVTSHNTLEDMGEVLMAGAADFLMKPMTEEMIRDKLQILGVIDQPCPNGI